MIKNILAVAIVVALSACSSGGNDDDDDTPGVTPSTGNPGTPDNGNPGTPGTPGTPDNGNPGGQPNPGVAVPAPGGGQPATPDTKAGSYIGSFGGAQGVYAVRNDFSLAGIAMNDDGSAQSIFGNLGDGDTFTGDVRQYIHEQSRPTSADGGFGSVGNAGAPLPIDVNIVNGQSIQGESPTAVGLVTTPGSSVAPATAASLAGSWAGVHSFCTNEGTTCFKLNTTLTFNGTAVTGATNVDDTGDVLINGTITEFADVALFDFNWGDAAGYSGLVYFDPAGNDSIVFVGENQSVDNKTISGSLARQ